MTLEKDSIVVYLNHNEPYFFVENKVGAPHGDVLGLINPFD